jgi:hypothetical protein
LHDKHFTKARLGFGKMALEIVGQRDLRVGGERFARVRTEFASIDLNGALHLARSFGVQADRSGIISLEMNRTARSLLLLAMVIWAGQTSVHAQPAWYGQPQFFSVFDFQSVKGSVVGFTGQGVNIPFTGLGWGWQYNQYPTTSNAYVVQDVAAWKAVDGNGPYFASISLDTIYLGQGSGPNPAWDAFRMRMLGGQYQDQFDSRKSTFADYSLSSPVFQSFLLAAAEQAADAGADGLLVDDVQSQLASILYYSPSEAGSFDSVTMAAFNLYLQQNFSAAQLISQFGIPNISAFNFQTYIQENGLANTWNQTPLSGLPLQFFFFKRLESLNFLRTLAATAKQYAMQTYGRNFLITCNDNDDPTGLFVTDVMDMTSPELFYIQPEDHPFHAVDIKSWTGWKWPSAPLAETSPSPLSGVTMPLSAPTVNLERIILADEQASGGIPGVTMQMNVGLGVAEPVNLNEVSLYANFILGNPQIMTHTPSVARVGLVHSAASVFGGHLSYPGQNDPWSGYSDYLGTALMLLANGLTYDAVFFPDTSYSQLPAVTVESLAKYSVVIAPYVFALDSNQESVLLEYAQQGGTLVIDGGFATNEPSGPPANHPELGPILAAPGVRSYGSGTIVFTNGQYGVQYMYPNGISFQQTPNISAQQTTRAAFQAFLQSYIQPDVQVSQPPAQQYDPGVTPFFERDNTGNALVHMVNYDYSLASDQFYTKTNITVQVNVGSQAVNSVILRSPDMTGVRSLPFTRSGGVVTVVIPQIEAWAVLYLQEGGAAPVINSVSPTQTLSAVGGTSVSFSVIASDPNGNPLTYIWSVNGTVVSGVFGPGYTLQLPSTASGTYNVVVNITDGSKVTETSWTLNVAPYRPPRFLFDETHAERNSMSATRAQQLNPEHPTWVLFSILEAAIAPSYQVNDLLTGTAGSLTSQLLGTTDVLVLAAPDTPLTTAENQAVANFVLTGGGLIFLGDDGLNTSINSLLEPWGVQFNATGIESVQNPGCAGCFYLSTFVKNPALGPNPSYYTNYGGSLTISQNAAALGMTSSAEWESFSGDAAQQPGEPNGPFVMVGSTQAGSGRVFVVSDNAFHDDYLQYSSNAGNEQLFLSALQWVTAAVNAPPAPPTGQSTHACDVRNNGVLDISDVQLMINEVLGVAAANNDLNRDGVVNVADIQIELAAVMSFGCSGV